MKFVRINNHQIQMLNVGESTIIIGKDYGSHGRSKPFYYVEINNKVIMHGFDTQKEAKQYLSEVLNETR